MDPIKRTHVPRLKLEEVKEEEANNRVKYLRKSLPTLNPEAIRRFRMPLHQALIAELKERGCINSAEFLRQLVEFNKDFRKKRIYDLVVMSRPELAGSRKTLLNLYEAFEKAENHYNKGNFAGEIDEFFEIAVLYGYSHSDDWWWLADQLFTQIIKMSTQYEDDNGYREAEAYYIYGKYLADYKSQFEEAVEFLNMSRLLSKEQNWCVTKLKKFSKPKLMFVLSSSLLYSIWVKQIKNIILEDPERAMEFCMFAKQIVFEACLPKAEIYFLQGRCEMELGRPMDGLKSFQKSHNLYKGIKDIENACEARIYIALCYLEMGNWEKTSSELQNLLNFAIENNMPHYEGLAYLQIGQFNLNQGTPERATSVLVKAFDIFHELNDVDQREFVNNLAAISRGQELFANYTNMILKCEGTGEVPMQNLLKLVRWKDSREPFWDDMSLTSAKSVESLTLESQVDLEEVLDVEEVEEEEVQPEESTEIGEEINSLI